MCLHSQIPECPVEWDSATCYLFYGTLYQKDYKHTWCYIEGTVCDNNNYRAEFYGLTYDEIMNIGTITVSRDGYDIIPLYQPELKHKIT